MGKKDQTQTSTQNQTYTPTGLSDLKSIWDRVQRVASTPYQPYTGETVADLTPTQLAGIQQVGASANAASPYFARAFDYATAGGAPISDNAINRYMSPYTQSVIDATRANFAETNAQQQQQVTGNAALRGALGGDRVGIAQAELARQQKLAQDPVIAGLYSDAYSKALGAAQADRGAAQTAAGQFGTLAPAMQNAAIQGGMGAIGAGGVQQQQSQAELDSAYQQYLQALAFPYQQTQFLTSLGLPVVSSFGGSQSGQSTSTAPGASPWGQVAGLGLTALSLFSDSRVKENIEVVGKDFSGQNIYRFNYKGDPKTHIGYMAQEVEGERPYAVGAINGVKTVDYGAATDDAARKGHYASGGAIDFMEIPGFIPKVGSVRAASAPNFSSMSSPRGQSKSGFEGITPESVMSGFGGARNLFNSMTAQPGPSYGGVYDPSAWMVGTDSIGGAFSRGGGINDFASTVRSMRGLLKREGYANGGPVIDMMPDSGGIYSMDRIGGGFNAMAASPFARTNIAMPVASEGFGAPSLPAPQNAPIMTASPSIVPQAPSPFANAIGGMESGNRYNAIGPETGKGRALGRYQVMDFNVGPWTKEVLGMELSPQEFLQSPAAQDAVFNAKFGAYKDKFGPEGAARAWFAGEGGMNDPNRRDVLGTSVASYADKFNRSIGASPSTEIASLPPNAQPAQYRAESGRPLDRLFGSDLSDEARMGLMAAGLGMMASQSPYALSQIGEGGLMGLRAYSAAKKGTADRATEQQKVDLQARRLAQDAEQFAKKFGLEERQIASQERAAAQPKYQVSEVFDEKTGQPRKVLIDTKTGEMRPLGGAKSDMLSGLSPAQKAVDTAFGKDYASFVGGGFADAQKNIQQLRGVVSELESGSDSLSGPFVGLLPDKVASVVNPKALDLKERVQEVVQRNLRLILGSQFTEREGERLISRAFNERLDEKTNAARLKGLVTAMEKAYAAKVAAMEYYQQNGTMRGYKGPTNIGVDDLERDMTAAVDRTKTPQIPAGVPAGSAYSPSRKMWRAPDGTLFDESGKRVQ